MGESRTLLLNPYLTIVPCTDDEMLVRRGSRSRYSKVISDAERSRVLGDVVRSFAGTATDTDVVAGFDEERRPHVENVIERLVEEGVLLDERTHVPSLLLGLAESDARPLTDATVTIVGTGAIADQVEAQLRGMGVGTLSPLTEVDDLDAVEEALIASDLTIVAVDRFWPTLLHAINGLAVDHAARWLPVHADGNEVVIGPLVVPGASACYNEFEIQHEAARVLRAEYLMYKEAAAEQGASPAHVPAPAAAVAAGYAVMAAIPFVTTDTSFLVGTALRVDLERLEVIRERVLRLPRCPACASVSGGTSHRHPFL